MSCETKTDTIGEHEYSVRQWSAEKALKMKFRIVKVVGSALATLSAGDPDKDFEGTLGKAIEDVFKNNDPDEIVALLKDSIIGVARDGTKITESSFNEHFSGDDLQDVYRVFVFVLRVNFGNFLKGQRAEEALTQVERLGE